MDTNLVETVTAAVTAALAQGHSSPAALPTHEGQTALLIATMVLAALGPILSEIRSYFRAKTASAEREAAKVLAKETSDTVEKVHIAVNSGQTAMIEKFDAERAAWAKQLVEFGVEIKRLSIELATSTAREEGSEKAKVLALMPAVPAAAAVLAAPAKVALFSAEQIAQLREALRT